MPTSPSKHCQVGTSDKSGKVPPVRTDKNLTAGKKSSKRANKVKG